MNFPQQKTLLVAGQGWIFVRATGKRLTAPVALRVAPNQYFGAIRYETID